MFKDCCQKELWGNFPLQHETKGVLNELMAQPKRNNIESIRCPVLGEIVDTLHVTRCIECKAVFLFEQRYDLLEQRSPVHPTRTNFLKIELGFWKSTYFQQCQSHCSPYRLAWYSRLGRHQQRELTSILSNEFVAQ